MKNPSRNRLWLNRNNLFFAKKNMNSESRVFENFGRFFETPISFIKTVMKGPIERTGCKIFPAELANPHVFVKKFIFIIKNSIFSLI